MARGSHSIDTPCLSVLPTYLLQRYTVTYSYTYLTDPFDDTCVVAFLCVASLYRASGVVEIYLGPPVFFFFFF